MKFFEYNRPGETTGTVFVNPDLVTSITPSTTGKTHIQFDADNSVIVVGDYREIAGRLGTPRTVKPIQRAS